MELSKKNKKTAIYIGIVAVVLIVIGYLAFGNGSSSKGYSEDIQAYFDAINAEGQNSLEKIDQALEDGEIDSETALVYKIYALFGDDRLSENLYDQRIFREGTFIVYEMNSRWEELSAETKELLEPYHKRPEEEGSWVNLRYGNSTDNAEISWLIPNAHATRASAYTEFFISADGKVKIWYPSISGSMNNINTTGTTLVDATTGKAMAKKLKGFLDNDSIIDEYETLLNKQLMSDGTLGGDSKYDIYVAPCGSSTLGLTYAEHDTPTPGYIIINYSIGLNKDNQLKTVLAHELFHAFQYTYDYDVVKDNWWGEATAVWSENFIYPEVNSEHGWLRRFIPHPTSQADKENPPTNHHYGAYIMAYFITENFDNDFMRKSWEYCDGNSCLEGIDKNIEGGFKEQWKKFTLWNYNKKPAQYYMDMGPFPLLSSFDADTSEDFYYSGGDDDIDIQKLVPLSADLIQVNNLITDTNPDGYKKITFNDLDKFTSKSDKASIKAVIYLKNGEKMVEDWTKNKRRSFCLENEDEDLERVVLIFSNADMEKDISESKIKIESKKTCFHIDEKEDRTAVIHFPVQNGTVDINTTIDAVADGEPETDAPEKVDYAYQTKWSVWYEFEQIKNAFSVPCEDTTADFEAGWTTRAAGYLKFNLDPESEGYNKENNTFSIDMHWGEPHPHGNMEDAPGVGVNCAGIYIGPSKINLSGYKGVSKGIYTGKITNMTANGAEIEIENCCLYHDCTTQQGAPFQTISSPIILEIRKYSD